jgi:hypothetical protein
MDTDPAIAALPGRGNTRQLKRNGNALTLVSPVAAALDWTQKARKTNM